MWKSRICCLLIGLVLGFGGQIAYNTSNANTNDNVQVEVHTNVVQKVVQETNVVEVIESTNAVERINVNYNWFKYSNDYIWDGWKIK